MRQPLAPASEVTTGGDSVSLASAVGDPNNLKAQLLHVKKPLRQQPRRLLPLRQLNCRGVHVDLLLLQPRSRARYRRAAAGCGSRTTSRHASAVGMTIGSRRLPCVALHHHRPAATVPLCEMALNGRCERAEERCVHLNDRSRGGTDAWGSDPLRAIALGHRCEHTREPGGRVELHRES